MTALPDVVALLPAWRAEAFIAQTLEALARQTYPAFTVLISDDASPDGTAAICAAFAARDPRFTLIRQPRNLGWTGNVNALLAAARGTYQFFAFHDDLPAPDYVTRLVAALEGNARAAVAYSDIRLTRADGREQILRYARLDGVRGRAARGIQVAMLAGKWWIPNRGVFRAEAAARIGGLRRHAAGEFSADWPWLLHLALLGESVRVPEVLCHKIYTATSLSRSWRHGLREWWAVTRSCAAEVRRSPLGGIERVAVYAALALGMLRQLALAVRRAPRRMIRA